MSDAREPQEVESIGGELIDRFGEPPPPVRSLLYVILVRVLAAQAGVQAVAMEDGRLVLKLREGLLVPGEALESRAPRGVSLGRTLVKVELGEGWRTRLREILESLAAVQPATAGNPP
jgi:transcription-repair coupling factor (superfamily II helicase)